MRALVLALLVAATPPIRISPRAPPRPPSEQYRADLEALVVVLDSRVDELESALNESRLQARTATTALAVREERQLIWHPAIWASALFIAGCVLGFLAGGADGAP